MRKSQYRLMPRGTRTPAFCLRGQHAVIHAHFLNAASVIAAVATDFKKS